MRSFNSFKASNVHTRNCLLLLLVCLLAYWPLTFGIFSVKNDAIHYFLPYRYNISEALRNGEWPFWSPYIYLGNPVYGDMQSGAWNPIVWLFSMIGRYDLTLFHCENLLYIFVGGLGMYKLAYHFVRHSQTALLIGVSYMLSGFMLGGQLINWLAAAAFIPFVFLYFLRMSTSGKYINACKTAFALYFLFTAGYPSFFIITCYILFAFFVVRVSDKIKAKLSGQQWMGFLSAHLLMTIVFLGLSLPAIISYYDLLPYYQRGNGAAYSDVIQNSFQWQHLSTLLFPSTIKAHGLISSTDVTCRNIYYGLLFIPILAAFPPKMERRNILLAALALFALLFSLGDATPLRKMCYQFLPLMDSFRHPSQMRLFIILSLLLLTAPGLKKLLSNEWSERERKKFQWVLLITGVLILIFTVIALTRSNLFIYLNQFDFSGAVLKNILESISIADVVAVNGLIQLLFIALLYWKNKLPERLRPSFSLLCIINLFIMAQLVLPVTFVGKTSPKEINALIHQSPEGFPVTGLENSLVENSKDAFDHFNKIALYYFYNKKIGISKVMNSPAFLEEQESFINNGSLYDYVSKMPVTYIADSLLTLKDSITIAADSTNTATVTKLSANHVEIKTNTGHAAILLLTQNYHRHWQASIDDQPATIKKVNTAFMAVEVPTGIHHVKFLFQPKDTLKAMWIQLFTIILLLIVGILFFIRNKRK